MSSNTIEILLVEDNAGDARLTLEAFKEGRVLNHLTVMQGGVQALAYLQDHPVDLIISDYRMPEMTGHELALEIRRLRPETRVVIFSSSDIPDETRNLVDAVIPKTDAIRELLPTVTRLCSERPLEH